MEIDPENETALYAKKRLEQGKSVSGAVLRSLVSQNQRKIDADSASAAEAAEETGEATQDTAEVSEGAEAKRTAVSPIAHNTEFTEEEARYIVEEGAKEFGNAASSVVNSYMRGQDPQMYMAQAKLVFNYGKTMSEEKGIPYALNSPLLKSMDETQIRSLFNAGRMQAKAIPVTAVKGKGEVVLTGGIDYSLLDPVRQTQVNALSSFAKATGYTIELFESAADEEGRYAAELGRFDPSTGVIRIDINAGRDKVDDLTHYAMVRVASHEITHSFKKNAPQQYVALRDYVTGILADKGDFKRLVDKKMRELGVGYETAVDEVVADGCEMMLRNTHFAEKLARENRTLFEKIRDAIHDFFMTLRAAFEGVEIAHEEAALLKDAENLQKLWDEALARSVENVAAAEEVIKSGANPIPAREIITDGAVVVGSDGKMFSIRSMKSDIAEGKMFDDLMKYCGWSQARVNELRRQLTDLVAYMEPHREILDMNETYGREGRKFSPYKPNSDPLYQISMAFSTLCSKRLLTQYVIENLQLRENRPMSAEEQMAIRDMLIEYRQVEKGLQVACAMCYVEAARLKSPKQMQRWLDDPAPLLRDYFGKANKAFNDSVKEAQADFKESRGYARNAPKKEMSAADVRELNKIGPRMRAQYQLSEEEMQIVERAKSLPNSTYLTAGNLASLSETDPVIYRAYTSFVRTATRSKSLETDEPYYYGDSTRDNGNGIIVSDSFIEAVNRENGMRFSSWSDWRIQHLLDYIAAVIDNSVRGAAMHGYTKFAEEVRVLGKTGMMFNLSGVTGTQTGLNPDGSLNFSPTESIDINDAVELREEFPETAGLQCIGVSDDHIFALLRSDIIDYVIPYHVSGLNAGLRRMADIYGWKDYTSTQHAAIDSSVKHNGQEHWHEEPVYSEFFVGYDTGMTGEEAMQESARRYVQMCRERGLTPKFEKFVGEDGYWKLLVDRKMINQKTGELIRQKPVTPTFDFDAIKAVVDRYVENYDSGLEARALNHIVKNWDSVPGRIRELKKRGTKKSKAQQALDTLYNEMMAAQPKPRVIERITDEIIKPEGVVYSKRDGVASDGERRYNMSTNSEEDGAAYGTERLSDDSRPFADSVRNAGRRQRVGEVVDGSPEAGNRGQSKSDRNRALQQLIDGVPGFAELIGVKKTSRSVTRKEAQMAMAGLADEGKNVAKAAQQRATYSRSLATLTDSRLDKVFGEYSYPTISDKTKLVQRNFLKERFRCTCRQTGQQSPLVADAAFLGCNGGLCCRRAAQKSCANRGRHTHGCHGGNCCAVCHAHAGVVKEGGNIARQGGGQFRVFLQLLAHRLSRCLCLGLSNHFGGVVVQRLVVTIQSVVRPLACQTQIAQSARQVLRNTLGRGGHSTNHAVVSLCSGLGNLRLVVLAVGLSGSVLDVLSNLLLCVALVQKRLFDTLVHLVLHYLSMGDEKKALAMLDSVYPQLSAAQKKDVDALLKRLGYAYED